MDDKSEINKYEGGVAIFVVPRNSDAWKGSEGLWVTIAGWASAAEEKFGLALILTLDRVGSPAEVIEYPLNNDNSPRTSTSSVFKRYLPLTIKTFVKDIRLYFSLRKFNFKDYETHWLGKRVVFVWEHHDIFPGAGYEISKKVNAPLIKYVHAPQIWEASKWGVSRPAWGRLIERYYELASLKKAEVVACVSEEVSIQLVKMGLNADRIIVSPMAVNPKFFKTSSESADALKKEELGVKGKFVVGWMGTFRSFHAIDVIVAAFRKVMNNLPDSMLLLVGDGIERKRIQELVEHGGMQNRVIITGYVPFTQVVNYLRVFDIAVVSARQDQGFHYSPQKLREFLAIGKPTLAPKAGEVQKLFKDRQHLILYNVGDEDDLARHIVELYNDVELRKNIGQQGKKFILESSTWSMELDKVLNKLAVQPIKSSF